MLEITLGLVATSILIYIFGSLSEFDAKEGFMYTVYPWITTFPETFSTTVYVLKGYYGTAIANTIYSALFDAAAAFGVSTLVHGKTKFRLSDLAIFTVFGAMMFMFLASDAELGIYDAAILYAVLIISSVYSVVKYGWVARRFSAMDIARIAISLIMLAITSYILTVYVELLIPYLGEYISGIVSATLTSMPDIIVGAVYGIVSSNAQSQILGCIAHDFIENAATAAFIAGLLGKSFVIYDVVSTIALSAVAVMSVIIAAAFGRITRLEAIMLLIAFAVCSIFVVVV